MVVKADKAIFETLIAPLIGLIMGFLKYKYDWFLKCKDPTIIISKTIDISFIIFGFLLTVLTLIVQANTELKQRPLYSRLVKFNKRVVLQAVILGFYSLLYHTYYTLITAGDLPILANILFSVFVALLTWLILDSIYYVMTFYALALKKKI